MNTKRFSVIIFLLVGLIMPITLPRAAQVDQTAIPIAPPTAEPNPRFGAALAMADIDNDGLADLVVGAPNADVASQTDAGQAFVYLSRLGLERSTPRILQASTPVAEAHFGAVLLTGDVNNDRIPDILVGAPGDTAGGQSKAGRVYVFHGGAMFDTTADRVLQAPAPQAGARFGVSIAVGDFNGGGNDIVVGANLTDITTTGTDQMMTTTVDAGQAFVFFGPAFDRLTTTLQAATPEAGARFGTSVAAANLNADTFADVVVGGDRTNVTTGTTTQINAGEAVAFYGAMTAMDAMTGIDTTVDVTLRGATVQSGTAFARTMIGGDVNGDGMDDVVVGAPLFDASNSLRDVGEAYVFLAAMNISATPTASATVRGAFTSPSYFGTSLALGDVDGDAIVDIIAGAPGTEVSNLANAGRAFIVLSGAPFTGVLNANIVLSAPMPTSNSGFGQAVAAGDINGDTLADVVIGAPGINRVYIFLANAPVVPSKRNN
ncbi:MAG: FG-GAP-like repeat-containing protein [Acidobacteriota bacterium]|nr:integrin alpha [Blastocatellia bacterium]MDW8238908.1 FG-GAP-like repeat-containing protein [Acidobacteriota bacterium]